MLFGRPTVSDKEAQQRKIKGELLIEASAQMGVHALTVGEGDLVFGVDWLVGMAGKHGAPYVSANVVRSDTGQLIFPESLVVTLGSRRYGITGVTRADIALQDGRVEDPVEALGRVVPRLRAQNVDYVVLLAHTGLDEARTMTLAVPGIDLVFAGHSRRHQEDASIVGTTAFFEAGSRGKHVGEVRIDFTDGGAGWADHEGRERAIRQKEQLERQLRRYDEQIAAEDNASAKKRLERVRDFTQKKIDGTDIPPLDDGKGHTLRGRRVPMNRDIADQKALGALVDSYLALLGPGNSGNKLKDALANADIRHVEVRESYGDFVSARACMSCHKEEHKDWMGTTHSRAYAGLVKDQRHFDLDCWSCHVTGAGQKGGPTGPGDVGPLKNVQCEACHGPGRAHSLSEAKADIVRSPTPATCLACHTEEQTEGRFVYADYLPKIDHR